MILMDIDIYLFDFQWVRKSLYIMQYYTFAPFISDYQFSSDVYPHVFADSLHFTFPVWA